jgi:hypothetical protein
MDHTGLHAFGMLRQCAHIVQSYEVLLMFRSKGTSKQQYCTVGSLGRCVNNYLWSLSFAGIFNALQYLLFYQIALTAAYAEVTAVNPERILSSLFNFNLCVIHFKAPVKHRLVRAIWCPAIPQLTTATTSCFCSAEVEQYRHSRDSWSG